MPKTPICCNPCKNNSVSNPPSSRQTQQFSKLSLKRVLNGELSTHHNRLYSPTYINQQNTNNKCFLREKSCKQILYRPPTSKQIKPIHKNKITEQILILPFDGHKWQKVKQKQQTRISLATSQRTHPQKMIKTHKKTQYTSDNSSLTEINRINAEMTKAQKQYRQRMRYLKQIKQQYIQGIH